MTYDKRQREMEIKKIQITLLSELRGLVVSNLSIWAISREILEELLLDSGGTLATFCSSCLLLLPFLWGFKL